VFDYYQSILIGASEAYTNNESKEESDKKMSDIHNSENETAANTPKRVESFSNKSVLSDVTNLNHSTIRTNCSPFQQSTEHLKASGEKNINESEVAPNVRGEFVTNKPAEEILQESHENKKITSGKSVNEIASSSNPSKISQHALPKVADSSITDTQMAAIFEEDFQFEDGVIFEPNGTSTDKPAASTPVTREDKRNSRSCDRKSKGENCSHSLLNSCNLSGDMFEAPSTNSVQKHAPSVNWSTESPFHCSPNLPQNDHDVISEDTSHSIPFSNYLRQNQQDLAKSVQSIENELSKVSLSNSHSTNSTCLNELLFNDSIEFTPVNDADAVSEFQLYNYITRA